MPVKVLSATYASNHKGKDVTQDCIQIVAGGGTTIPVNDSTFGDPDRGSTKYFTITLAAPGGLTLYQGCEENTNLVLATS